MKELEEWEEKDKLRELNILRKTDPRTDVQEKRYEELLAWRREILRKHLYNDEVMTAEELYELDEIEDYEHSKRVVEMKELS